MRNTENSTSLIDIIVSAWRNLNVDIIAPYLSDNFQYNSAWVSRTLNSKHEYLQYLHDKFESIKKSGDLPIIEIIHENGKSLPHIRQANLKSEAVLDYIEENGKIRKLFMRPLLNIEIEDDEVWNLGSKWYHDTLSSIYSVAGNCIQDYLQSIHCKQKDLSWLYTSLRRPTFQHLCFRYQSDVYSIIIALHGAKTPDGSIDDRIIVSRQDYENLLIEADKNNLVPCIIPIALRPRLPLVDISHLIHAVTGEIINLNEVEPKGNVAMSDWEINNMGIGIVLQYLRNQNYTIETYCDFVGIQPQIWFKQNGKLSYVIVRSIPVGKRKNTFKINNDLLLKFSNYYGYFADVQFSSSNPILRDENNNIVPLGKRDGDEDIWMWRGDGFYCNFRGLQEIEKAIIENPFIEIENQKLYDVE